MFSLYLKQAGQWGSVALLLILTGCASVPERHPLPPEYTLAAGIPGIPDARFWGDEWPTFAIERFEKFTVADFQREFDAVYDGPHHITSRSPAGVRTGHSEQDCSSDGLQQVSGLNSAW
jgi:hypothetical protein